MDDDVTAWLGDGALWDVSADALLRALLCDSPRTTIIDACHGGGATDAPVSAPPPTKRTRRPPARRKDEIERLQRSVADLESVLALHTERLRAPQSKEAVSDALVRGNGPQDMWKNVAARQFHRRRDAERENLELRDRVERQRAIVQSLVRLTQRARRELPSDAIPRTWTPVDATMYARKRLELRGIVATMFHSLDSTHPHASSIRLSESGEFRTTRQQTMPQDLVIPPGALLDESAAGRFVQSIGINLGDLLWARARASDMQSTVYKLQDVEYYGDNYSVVLTLEFPTPHGYARYHGVSIRARFQNGARDAIVIAGSIWPDASAPLQVQGSGFDLRSCMIVQPHRRSTAVNEVLVNVECSRLVSDSAQLTPPQAIMLESMAVRSQQFLLDQCDRYIDDVLLGDL